MILFLCAASDMVLHNVISLGFLSSFSPLLRLMCFVPPPIHINRQVSISLPQSLLSSKYREVKFSFTNIYGQRISTVFFSDSEYKCLLTFSSCCLLARSVHGIFNLFQSNLILTGFCFSSSVGRLRVILCHYPAFFSFFLR